MCVSKVTVLGTYKCAKHRSWPPTAAVLARSVQYLTQVLALLIPVEPRTAQFSNQVPEPRLPSCPGLFSSLKQVLETTAAVPPKTASLLIQLLAAHVEPDVPLHH